MIPFLEFFHISLRKNSKRRKVMQNLKILISFCAMVILAAAMAGAQSGETENKIGFGGQGYAFFAPGVIVVNGHSLGAAHVGGGGEAVFGNGMGIGAEAGYVGAWEGFGQGATILSIDGSYHFNRSRKVSPFVTGGYSLGISSDSLGNMVNFGGGIHYWFRKRLGLRLEFRDHVDRSGGQLLEGRIGIAFR
jgi:hypothetical protein